jgi:hypothetical protein
MTGKRENKLRILTGPHPKTVREAADAAIAYHRTTTGRHAAARRAIAGIGKEFHERAGTQMPQVANSIDVLDHPVFVVEAAHQPNVFPFLGTFKKLVLAHYAAEALRTETTEPVVEVFGIVDQDFANRAVFRRALLPDILSKDGVLTLRSGVSKDDRRPMCALDPPDPQVLAKWEETLVHWLRRSIHELEGITRRIYGKPIIDPDSKRKVKANLDNIRHLVRECADRARTFSEFNAFFISQIVNRMFGYPTVFYEYSRLEADLTPQFAWLLSIRRRYVSSFNLHWRTVADQDIELNFPMVTDDHTPFWLHCECKAKAPIWTSDEEGKIRSRASCSACGKESTYDFGQLEKPSIEEVAHRVSSRAVSRYLLSHLALGADLYVSGLGAIGFGMVARGVALDLGMPLPPFVVWPSRDHYVGIGQALAWMTTSYQPCQSHYEFGQHAAKLEQNIRKLQTGLKELREKLGTIEPSRDSASREANARQVRLRRTELLRTQRKLRDSRAAMRALGLVPSILDLAVNSDMKVVESEWGRHLREKALTEVATPTTVMSDRLFMQVPP